ncbi:MAG: poly(R)-hydroxyalkanoic acid synthase subunit PhaE [Bacteroidota bacterium]|nr:hypothetical protein [Candidatus Kapabacteria bacterium]MDW8220710.1 poly(R)-hydroxyalkanoic acid synthase subunit PhaE [Bacteroidota bacterium]
MASFTGNILTDLLNMQLEVVKKAADAAGEVLPANLTNSITTMLGDLAGTVVTTLSNTGSSFTGFANVGSISDDAQSSKNFPFNFLANMQGLGNVTQMVGNVASLYDTWKKLYSSWMGAMGRVPAAMADMVSNGSVVVGAVNNLTTMAQTYFKLSEMLAPLVKMTENTGITAEMLQKYLNVEEYNKIIAQAFNFPTEETMKQFTDQVNMLASYLGNVGQIAGTNVGELTQMSAKALTAFTQGNVDEAAKIYVDMIDSIQKPVNPITNMIFFGRDRVAIELLQEMLKAYVLFAAQYSKMQQMIFGVGKDAIANMTGYILLQAKEGKAPRTFDEFFQIFIGASEKAFDTLFNKEEYAKLQGELAVSGARVKEHTDRFIELMLSELPIATRSELDEAYQSIHFLKTQVRRLERKLAEQEERIEALSGSTAASSKKTAAKDENGTASTAKTSKKPSSKKVTAKN